VAVALRDAPSLLVRDRMMALGLHLVGRQTEARPYADRALSHPAALTRSIHKSFHEYDSQVASRSHLSRILWLQGFADQAAALVQEGVDYAVALDYPPPLCYVLVYAACPIAFWTGDVAAVAHYTALLGEQAANLSFGYWQSWKNCYAAVGALGGDDGSAGFRQQVLAVRATAATPIYIDMLATLRPDLAGPEAVARVQAGQAGWCAAEILRAAGVAAIGHGDLVKAEAILRRSLALAQEQGAWSWALRSATTLAGLYRDGGQPGAARGVLAPVYDGFTEGFGTADLMRADALMRTL
jgi:hypothetical protein